MDSYIRRYEALQQERLRSRRQRASDIFSSAASASSEHAPPLCTVEQPKPALSVASDEFVDAAAYLEKNQLGGDDSFELEVAQQRWERPDESARSSESGRPSDFFEKRSRNLERVDFALENERCSFDAEQEAADSARGHESAAAPSARPHASLASSDTNTALSSGFEVHFDSTRQAFTPNSLKYLQEKSRMRQPLGMPEEDESDELDSTPDHTNEARNDTQRRTGHRLVASDADDSHDELPEAIQAMQRGPGAIVDALNEIDALIAAPRRTDVGARRDQRSASTVHDIVREYDLSLETGLPLSRTTDSWGDDPDDEPRDEPVSGSPRSREPPRPSCLSDAHRLRRGEHSTELGTIQESRFSSLSTMENINQLYQINEECDTSLSSAHTGETLLYASRARAPAAHETPEVPESVALAAQKNQQPFDEPTTPRKKRTGVDMSTRARAEDDRNNDNDTVSYDKRELSSPMPAGGNQRRDGAGYSSSTQTPAAQKVSTRTPGKNSGAFSRQLFSEEVMTPNDTQPNDAGSQRVLFRRSGKEEHIEGLAITPSQLSRRCRRLLCTVGETMTEQIVVSNGSDAVARISVSLLPLSTGCQQYSVSPAVLELRPRASSAFYVTLTARTPGVAAGVFQFRGVGVKSLFSPYEVLIEASVRRNLALEDDFSASDRATRVGASPRDRRVEELRRSKCLNEVEVGPTFIKFERLRTKNGVRVASPSTLTITNNSDATLPFSISCAHENLKVTPSSGMIPPASEATVALQPLAQPLERRSGESLASARSMSVLENWTGSFTVVVGEKVAREVSFVVAREVLETLPPFDAIARSRHHISSQTDAFYYTKKRNRRGLYFHARAVECGSCSVGESHHVPVYICNGSSAPMTVFLQDLMDPFSCAYSTTTIEPRKFIEVLVAFTPKVAGKVSTSLFAYSVSEKAVVTLVARGI
ncbi:hypothetical protein PybrP1_012691 [[Pythium] brassicae (nom. inval.)]|nr:hypothetical protein PybrP1_012691 [[Pythium] brassicae (nom. inval.)]